MRSFSLMLVTLVIAVGLPRADAPGQTTQPDDHRAAEGPAHPAQPRLLYGCGIIPGAWSHKPRSYDERCLRMIRAMGGTHFWINVAWADMEPAPGEKDRFEYTDFLVRTGREQGLEVLAIMTGTPKWALPPEYADKPGMRYRCPPADEHRAAFESWCKAVAERYRGRIKYYQFWNEPNGCTWIKDNCSNSDQFALYTRWLKVWYPAMKAADPGCRLAAGGLDYHDGVTEGYKYLEGMYREGAKGYFDAFAIHPYDKSGNGTIHLRAIRDIHGVMVAHGDADKPVWITEYAWADLDPARKADFMRRTLAELNKVEFSYVGLATYLSLTDPPHEGKDWGLCDEDLTPRPAYLAFKAFTKSGR